MSEASKKKELFQYWLIEMDDAIERFCRTLDAGVAARLDWSPDSLEVLEGLILERYASGEALAAYDERHTRDAMARYVGEVLRKHCGGIWYLEVEDAKNVFYGVPQLVKMRGQSVQICPLTLVTAAASRRKGDYLREVLDSCLQDAGKGTPQA